MLTKGQIIKKLKDMKAKALAKSYDRYLEDKKGFGAYLEEKLLALHDESFITDYNLIAQEMNSMSSFRFRDIALFLKNEDLKGQGLFTNQLGTEDLKPIEKLYHNVIVSDWQFSSTAYGNQASSNKKERDEKIETEFNALIGNALSMKTLEIRALAKTIGLDVDVEDKPCTALLSPTDMSYLKEVIKQCQETTSAQANVKP